MELYLNPVGQRIHVQVIMSKFVYLGQATQLIPSHNGLA